MEQKYAIYRDNELIVSGIPSLATTGQIVKKDARNEHDHGRPARYEVKGSEGFTRHGSHYKGRMRWDGELKIKSATHSK